MSYSAQYLHTCFASDYQEGRCNFLKACQAMDLTVHSCIHPRVKSRDGKDLALDYTWIGDARASKVLLIMCGTHGLEADSGSAAIVHWLQGGMLKTLPKDTAVLLIHAVNPYGWAYSSRSNEDGVDLNRNCLDHNQAHPLNSVYDEFHPLIKAANIDAKGLAKFVDVFHAYTKKHGAHRAIGGITKGQYVQNTGLSFGGTSLSWSIQTLYNIVDEHLHHARKISIIDLHTGIGEFGKPFFIIENDKNSKEYALATSWWPSDIIHADDVFEGGSPEYTGLLNQGLTNQISTYSSTYGQAEIVSVVIEWGTYGVDAMLQALLMDIWLCTPQANTDLIYKECIRTRLVERFSPSVPEWQQAVLAHSTKIFAQALTGLSKW